MYQAIIDKYYPDDDDLRRLLLKHSRLVADRCLEVCSRHPEMRLDAAFVEQAAMLHDIGVRWCHAPSIFCCGNEPYVRHGIIGARLLREECRNQRFPASELEAVARVCERHTGTGITLKQIERQNLPLPPGDYTPETMEEKLICYADKFFSKSRPEQELTAEQVAQSLERFGHEGVETFLSWHRLFG